MTEPNVARAAGAAVRFDRVSKRFGSLAVLDEVSFDIPKGKAFCLLGKSGTGKSVTLRHIIGLVQPDSGKVFVEGSNADLGTLFDLHRDVTSARRVVADKNRAEPWSSTSGDEARNAIGQLHLDATSNAFTVE